MYLKYVLFYRKKNGFFFNRYFINIRFGVFINRIRVFRVYKDLRYCDRNKTLCIEGKSYFNL